MLCTPVGYSSNYQKPRKIFVEQGGFEGFKRRASGNLTSSSLLFNHNLASICPFAPAASAT